jgi:predicted RNA polymerase sigma factor
LQLYTVLLTMEPSPVVRVHHAVALAETVHLPAALATLDSLQDTLPDFQPFHAALAAVLAKAGHVDAAKQAFATAIRMATLESDQWLLMSQVQRLG